MNAVDDTSKALGEYAVHEEHPSLLVVIIDTHPGAWASLDLTLRQAVNALLVFMNGHIAMNNSNKVAVIAAHTTCARFLYPAIPNHNNAEEEVNNGEKIKNGQTMYRQFRELDDVVITQLEKLLAEDSKTDSSAHQSSSAISGAMSLALSYINRACEMSDDTRMASRMFLLSVSGGLTSQYIPAMNSIFAAQKRRIPIDVCKLGGDTVFLQQASDSTNGTYIKIDHPKGLIKYLMSAFTIEPGLRSHINLATQKDVDFRAACFVTNNVVEVGYVCSVCLCIMSVIPESNQCPMCSTGFDPSIVAKFYKKPVVKKKVIKKKKPKTTNSDSNNSSPVPNK